MRTASAYSVWVYNAGVCINNLDHLYVCDGYEFVQIDYDGILVLIHYYDENTVFDISVRRNGTIKRILYREDGTVFIITWDDNDVYVMIEYDTAGKSKIVKHEHKKLNTIWVGNNYATN